MKLTGSASIIRFFKFSLLLSVFILVSACGGGGGGGSSTQTTSTSRDITGGGVKGPLANAVVTVYSLDATQPGFKGVIVATATTDSSAAITGLALPFPLAPPYIMEFTSDAGTTDITTGQAPVIDTLRTVIKQTLLDTGEQIYATPLTTMAVDIAVTNSNATTTTAQFEAALTTAATQVVSTVGFGMSGDIDIFDVPPLVDDTTDTTAEQSAVAAYRSAVEALTAVVFQMEQQSSGVGVEAILTELSMDLADGVIDGTVNGGASTIFTSTTLDVLAQDPATLTIPNTTQTVADVQSILVSETATTGSTTSTTELSASGSIVTTTQTALTNPDSDGDGTLNANDTFPQDPGETVDSDGDGIGDNTDPDDDNNGILDVDEGTTPAPTATDADGDGIIDSVDNCLANFNPAQTNTDSLADGGDACDSDDDEDGTPDSSDSFPLDAGEQADADNDGIGNVADTDDDNDGLLDVDENAAASDPDGDGIPNREDTDSDNDGVLDSVDFAPYNSAITFNIAPTTADGSVTTNEDVAVAVILNVSDDGVAPGPLVYSISGPSNGALSGIEPNLTYTPIPNFNGSDSFTFIATDSGGQASNTSTVSITVNLNNDAPVIAQTGPLVVGMDEDSSPIGFVAPTITAGDVDGDTLTWTGTAALNGTATVSGTGASPTISYAPNLNFNGGDSFNVIVTDGSGSSDSITVNVTVATQNDPPVGVADAFSAGFSTATVLNVLANDTDVDGVLTITNVTQGSSGGTVTIGADGSTVTYTDVNNGTVNTETFTYDISDGVATVAGISVTMTITTNVPPVANPDSASTNEDVAVTTGNVLDNDNDGGDGPGSLTITTADTVSANGGNVLNNGNGTFTYTPAANFNGPDDTFTYTVSDGVSSSVGLVTITVNSVNDAPVAIDDSDTAIEDATLTTINVLTNDTDIENSSLSVFAADVSSVNGGVVVNNTDGTFDYTPPLNFNGDDTFTYTVTDGSNTAVGTVTITVTPVNDAPTFTTSPLLSVTEGNTYNYLVSVNDFDPGPDTLTLSATTLPLWMNFDVSTGILTGSATNAVLGAHPVVIQVNDGTVNVVQSFTVNVNGIGASVPIAMTDLLGPIEGGRVVLDSDEDFFNGLTEFSYFSISYDSSTSTLDIEDAEFNYLSGDFDIFSDELEDFTLNAGDWVTGSFIRVTAIGTGTNGLGMDITVNSASDVVLESLRLSAEYVDITGQSLASHLEGVWQLAMFDVAAEFPLDSKLITTFNFETLVDTYSLEQDEDCASFTFLNGNCNAIYTENDPSGYATTLDQVIAATAWEDPDTGETPPETLFISDNDGVGNNQLEVQLVSGGVANYYVLDFSNVDPAQVVSAPTAGTWVRDSSVQGVDMIRYTIPQAFGTQFTTLEEDGFDVLLAVHNGFVREGGFSLSGDDFSESDIGFNGIAMDQILANFSGFNFTQALEGTTLYDIYLDIGLGEYLIDIYDFGLGGVFTLTNFQDGSVEPIGTWDVSAIGVLHLTSGGDEWWMKVTGQNPEVGNKRVCASGAATGPFNCTPLDVGTAFGIQHTDQATAVAIMDALNSSNPEVNIPLKNPDGSRPIVTGTLSTTQFNTNNLATGTHTLELASGQSVTLTFNTDGSGSIEHTPTNINQITWFIDAIGVLRFTETDSLGDQWFWVLGYFDSVNMAGNVLVQTTTPQGQANAADLFFIGGLFVTAQNGGLSGQWRVTESYDANVCGDIGVDLEEVSVLQVGSGLTINKPTGGILTGLLNGNEVSISGSFADDEGTVTINSLILTLSLDGNSMTGTSSTTWTDNVTSCDTGSKIFAYKIASNSGVTVDYASLNFRTFESSGTLDRYRAIVGILKNGRGVLKPSISSVFLRDSGGAAILPVSGAPEFFTDHYLFLDWDNITSEFTQQLYPDDSYYWFNLDNHSGFGAGQYSFEVNPSLDIPVEFTFQFPGPISTPAVAGSSVVATWTPEGDLQISWPLTNGIDQYRIGLFTDNTVEYIWARMPGNTNSVVISRSAIDWLDEKSTDSMNNFYNLSFQSRTNVDGNGISRHHSISQNVIKQ